ncbi:hypothetical protein BD560DRAFT_380415 [Blakeslea trispora]|nr:hypothetical protein BD560DRAFT_380415 [Blakeslea trispora]
MLLLNSSLYCKNLPAAFVALYFEYVKYRRQRGHNLLDKPFVFQTIISLKPNLNRVTNSHLGIDVERGNNLGIDRSVGFVRINKRVSIDRSI